MLSRDVGFPLVSGPWRSENPVLSLRGPLYAPKQAPRDYVAEVCW